MIVLFILAVALLPFLVFRNLWVFKKGIEVLDADHKIAEDKIAHGDFNFPDGYHPNFEKLPPYTYMLFCFWVWDIKKFLPNNPSPQPERVE